MLLAVDIGNTNTVLGLFDGEKLLSDWRLSSAITRTEDECWIVVKLFLENCGMKSGSISRVGISSVVPNLTEIFQLMARKYFNVEPLTINSDLDLGMKLHYDNPAAVGADRICNAVAGFAKFGGPLIIIDFGTATTYDVVSKSGDYLGGVIAPGIETAAADLHRRAAKLPKIELRFPGNVIGTDTVSSMQSGILHGAVDSVEGMIRRIKGVLGQGAKVAVTGGHARLVHEHSHGIDYLEPSLVLHGIRLIYERNQR
ncbi:MAG TPA: type III pantothenate kinase, partial [Bacteroidota bacterium]